MVKSYSREESYLQMVWLEFTGGQQDPLSISQNRVER